MKRIWAEEQRNDDSAAQRYNLEAQRAIHQARTEAQLRGSGLVTVGDLLAGLTWEQGTRADRIGNLKTNAMYLRWLVGNPQLPSRNTPNPDGQTELDHGVRIALAYAWAEADRDEEKLIGTDHLLRGLLRFPNVAHFALLKTEVNLQSVRTGSKLDRKELLPKGGSKLLVYQYLIQRSVEQFAYTLHGMASSMSILFPNNTLTKSPQMK